MEARLELTRMGCNVHLMHTRLLAAAAAVLSLAPAALASGNAWHSWTINIVPENRLQTGLSGEIVDAQARDMSGDPVRGSVAFMCLNGELMVAVAEEDVPIRHVGRLWNRPKLRNTQARLIINGERQEAKDWSWARRHHIMLPQSKSDRAKIYNAVLRGHKVELDFSRFPEPLALYLPPSDATFRSFGQECGMGVYGKGVNQRT